jgi:hypothetical protein
LLRRWSERTGFHWRAPMDAERARRREAGDPARPPWRAAVRFVVACFVAATVAAAVLLALYESPLGPAAPARVLSTAALLTLLASAWRWAAARWPVRIVHLQRTRLRIDDAWAQRATYVPAEALAGYELVEDDAWRTLRLRWRAGGVLMVGVPADVDAGVVHAWFDARGIPATAIDPVSTDRRDPA